VPTCPQPSSGRRAEQRRNCRIFPRALPYFRSVDYLGVGEGAPLAGTPTHGQAGVAADEVTATQVDSRWLERTTVWFSRQPGREEKAGKIRTHFLRPLHCVDLWWTPEPFTKAPAQPAKSLQIS